jgi:hypothetical protein
MRILSLFALCLASAVSLSATGQSAQPAAPGTPVKNAPAQNASAQKGATANSPAQAASQQEGTVQNSAWQNAQADTPAFGQKQLQADKDLNRLLSKLTETAPAQEPGMRHWPQVSFDRGIYAGRNSLTAGRGCLAIQSYNFSQAAPGKMPKLESITTCTSVVPPLMRQARNPEAQSQQDQK